MAKIETAADMRWAEPPPPSEDVRTLAAALEQPEWFAHILVSRGIANPEDAAQYLQPTMDQMHDPMLLCGMRNAVRRVLEAVARREPILIYGDYDVDGTVATVLLKTAIDRITPASVESLVRYHIPHRIREGYGMQNPVLAEAAAQGVRLVISVDTGIRAFAAAEECSSLGLHLIVTDHHLPDNQAGVPEAIAVINPNQQGCEYPYKHLCGAAVAFKLAHALLQAASLPGADGSEQYRSVDNAALTDKLLPSLLKLVAIATVADAVPLTGENRVIVALGLRALRDPRQHGLRALMRLAGVEAGENGPSATEIAFRIAPRINAAGRMDVASDVVRLLLTRDAVEGRALAEKLHQLNDERRTVEADVLAKLEEQLATLRSDTGALDSAGCLLLDGEGWHRGVIGILASRVVERTGRPALVVAHEDGQAHGSGRSIAGFHLLDAITAAHVQDEAGIFDRFGGHAFAVGFSMQSDRLPLLRTRLAAYATERLTPELLQHSLTVDAEVCLNELTPELLRRLRLLEPFGHGNHEPVFLIRDARIAEEPFILKERHLKLRLSCSGSNPVACLCWSRTVRWPDRLHALGIGAGSRVDAVFRIRENRHPQFGGPEMELCDLRLSSPAASSVTNVQTEPLQRFPLLQGGMGVI